jgi:hypothetical protein
MKTLITALALSLPVVGFAQTAAEKAASDTKAAGEKAGSEAKSTADKAAADTSAAASHTKKKAKHSAKKATDETKAAGEAMTK